MIYRLTNLAILTLVPATVVNESGQHFSFTILYFNVLFIFIVFLLWELGLLMDIWVLMEIGCYRIIIWRIFVI